MLYWPTCTIWSELFMIVKWQVRQIAFRLKGFVIDVLYTDMYNILNYEFDDINVQKMLEEKEKKKMYSIETYYL